MKNEVPHAEAVEILRWMLDNPASVRGVRAVDGASYGPHPFFAAWRGDEAEVTLALSGGVLVGLESVRIGERFSNHHDWEDDPLDALRDVEWAFLGLSVEGLD